MGDPVMDGRVQEEEEKEGQCGWNDGGGQERA